MASTRLVLPCPLRPMNAVDARLEGDLGGGVRAEVVQGQVADVHRSRRQAWAWRRRRGGGWSRRDRRTGSHRRDRLHGGAVVLARDEPGVKRGGDAGDRDGVVDARLDGPAALARVLGVAGDLVEARVLVERGDQQVEQPGRITVPSRHESKTSVTLSTRSTFWSSSQPSA